MQYLLLDCDQIKCFPFFSNPKKLHEGYTHEFKDYAEVFNPDINIKEYLLNINKYFEMKFQKKQMSETDQKVWSILNPRVKDTFNNIVE